MTYVRTTTEEFDNDPRFYGVGANALWAYTRLKLLAAQGHVVNPPDEVVEQLRNSTAGQTNMSQICWLLPVDEQWLAQKCVQDVRTLGKNLTLLRQKCIIFVGRTRGNIEVIGLLNYYKYQADRLKTAHEEIIAAAAETHGLFDGIINKDKYKNKDKNEPDVKTSAEIDDTLKTLTGLSKDKVPANRGWWKDTPEQRRRNVEALRRYVVEFPAVDPVELARSFVAWHIGKPPRPKWNQVATFRTWFVKALEFGRALRNRPAGKGKMEDWGDMLRTRNRKGAKK